MVHESNAIIRTAAIRELGKRLKKPNKRNGNDSTLLSQILGDTQSMLAVFAESSVADVKHLCATISNSGRHGRQQQAAFEERQEAVGRLLRALLPAVYPSEPVRCRDKRPLQRLYANMLPACSGEFVEAVLDARDQSNPLFRWRNVPHLLRSHRALLRKRAVDHLFGHTSIADPDVHRYIENFLDHDKAFALSALHGRHDGTISDKRWGKHSEVGTALSLVERLVKRKHASKKSVAVQIRGLVQLGLEILARKLSTSSYRERNNVGVDLWTFALDGWRKWPEVFENALVLGLRLGLGSSPKNVARDYLSAASQPYFPEARRARLLQLYCLHVGKEGCDIFAEDANFTGLAKRPWPYEVFGYLKLEQSTRILKALDAVNQEYNFLQSSSQKVSIFGLRDVAGQKNFNVDLLLTQLLRDDPDMRQRARDAVDELRKKAAGAKEQDVRAAFVEAASAYAIATGDLQVYGETISWQQRFVRDPLTARKIFGRAAVLTEEGIELLSALRAPQGSESNTAASTERIRMADNILKTFYETYRLAKREPSFQPSDWSYVKSLFGAVYEKRVQQLQSLCSAEDIQVVWKGFLNATQWMDIEFLQELYRPVTDLLEVLTPELLATAVQDLLRVGAERRKEQNRTPEDDMLERMSYEALILLAWSSNPGLATDLVVQTIINRPDASSWHRSLLSIGILKRLRAKEAHGVLIKLAKAISEKLEEQSYVQVGESEPAAHAPPKSLVKVTTVKYLAQLLKEADFIPNDTAVEVLVELFKNAQHRDIRLAALESLLSLLDRLCTETKAEWATNPTINTIMAALEAMVPVVGSINDRQQLRDEDWADAEATGKLPEVKESPLIKSLWLAAVDTRYPGLKFMQSAYIKRLVLPILHQSQIEHGKWIRLFLAKYKAPFAESDVPVTPVAVHSWNQAFVSYYPLVGPAVLADFNAYAVHQIAPDARIEEFTAALLADVEVRKRAEVQHWSQTIGSGIASFIQSGTFTLLRVSKTHYGAGSKVDHDALTNIVLQHAKLFLDRYEDYAQVWEEFVTRLAPEPLAVRKADKFRDWQDTHGKIVRGISDELRKRRAQETHPILPSRTKLELWLLPYLALNDGDDVPGFVDQLEAVLLELLEGSESQSLGWYDMVEDVRTIFGLIERDELKSKVAGKFGRLTVGKQTIVASQAGGSQVQSTRALELIKVEIAMRLFDGCHDVEVIKGAGQERLKEWSACKSDGIRERVFRWSGRARIEKA